MAAIEHRTMETLLQAYRHFDKPNWAIFVGNIPRDHYTGGDRTQGEQRLTDYLTMIAGQGINQTYDLRVYDDRLTNEPTATTKFSQSTTFNIKGEPLTRVGEGGTIYVDSRPLPTVGSTANGAASAAEMKQLREEIERLKDDLQKERINNIKQEFTAAIGAIRAEKEEKSGWDKIIELVDKVIEKPEIITGSIGALGKIFRGENKDYIQQPGATHLAGTQQTADMDATDTIPHEFLTPDEKKMPKDQKGKILEDRLKLLTDEQHEDVQNDCMAAISERVGNVTLTRLVLAVTEMDDAALNMLLNML